MDNIQLTQVVEAKFVGVTFDEHLTFRPHIETVNNKLAKSVGIINRVKNYLPRHALLTLYFTMAYAHITYCCTVWSANYENNLHKIEMYQKKLVRIITRSPYNAHTAPLFKELRLLKFEDISTLCILKIMYEQHHQIKTVYDRLDLFEINQRHPDKYRIPFGRLNTTRFSIIFRGPTLWNNLESMIKNLPTIHRFKKEFHKKRILAYN